MHIWHHLVVFFNLIFCVDLEFDSHIYISVIISLIGRTILAVLPMDLIISCYECGLRPVASATGRVGYATRVQWHWPLDRSRVLLLHSAKSTLRVSQVYFLFYPFFFLFFDKLVLSNKFDY